MGKEKKPRPIYKTGGAPEWMATYSDMMSLLLCFFILLFSVSEEKQEKVYEVILGFQEYFKPKGKKLGYYSKKLTIRQIPGFIGKGVQSPSKTGDMGASRTKVEEIEKIDQFASIYEKDNRQLVVIPGMLLFRRGKAEIQEAAHPTLDRTLNTIKRRARFDLKIVGHTSSWPLGPDADASDHMMLGFYRAWNVAKYFRDVHGLDMKTVTLASMGSHLPDPSRRNLWEDPDKDDRVEITFLPRAKPNK